MRVGELMTERVITVGPATPLKEVARTMVEHGVSGVPVCDVEGHVLGVVSEGDILYREHDPGEGRRGPLGWLVDGSAAAAYAKAGARTARAAMTSPAITIQPYASAAQAARVMCERRVNRLPVVHDERLVGIVSRADLVRAFIRPDEVIERELREDVLDRMLWIEPGTIEVHVENGAVELSGRLHARADVELLKRLVAAVPGVTRVDSSVTWELDNRARRPVERIGS